MSLGSALNAAVNGLQTAQAGISVISENVSNANVAGYTRKTLNQTVEAIGNTYIGVRTLGTQRTVDTLLQSTLRTQVASQNYATTVQGYVSRLDDLYGTPGSSTALDGIYNNFTTALQTLSTSPSDVSAQSNVLATANTFAQTLNQLSSNIQSLRSETESGISDAVNQANADLKQIQQLDQQIVSASAGGQQPADLLDKRDKAIDDLASLVDIKVTTNQDNSVAISTSSGTLLYDRTPVTLTFDRRSTITATNLYATDPSQRGVGTISAITPSGQTTDLIANGAFRSGKISAYLDLRDNILPAAQDQLDSLAAGLSKALSDKTVQGTAATSGTQTGFNLDVSGLQDGDSITLQATVGGVAKTITIVRVDDPSKLPLANSATANPNDQVIGISFANGTTQAATDLQAALGTDFTVSSPASGQLQILNDAAAANQVNGLSATVTETSLQGGTSSLPFFVDGATNSKPFTNNLDGSGQQLGYAQRIALNPALYSDPGKLIAYAASVDPKSSDPTRPNDILSRLTQQTQTFTPAGGIGSAIAPTQTTITTYLQQIIDFQGAQASNAQSIKDGQDVVVNGLQSRFDTNSKVNTDTELANLVVLQQSYQASARVLSTVNQLFNTLFGSTAGIQ